MCKLCQVPEYLQEYNSLWYRRLRSSWCERLRFEKTVKKWEWAIEITELNLAGHSEQIHLLTLKPCWLSQTSPLNWGRALCSQKVEYGISIRPVCWMIWSKSVRILYRNLKYGNDQIFANQKSHLNSCKVFCMKKLRCSLKMFSMIKTVY
jgi:hypothetical protein